VGDAFNCVSSLPGGSTKVKDVPLTPSRGPGRSMPRLQHVTCDGALMSVKHRPDGSCCWNGGLVSIWCPKVTNYCLADRVTRPIRLPQNTILNAVFHSFILKRSKASYVVLGCLGVKYVILGIFISSRNILVYNYVEIYKYVARSERIFGNIGK
jgi:hypothetical protein